MVIKKNACGIQGGGSGHQLILWEGGGVACRGGTFKYCKFVNFGKGCIFAKLRSEDVLSKERICAIPGAGVYITYC